MSKTFYDETSKIWSGLKIDPVYNTKTSLGHVILSVLGNSPKQITQVSVENDAAVSCGQMKLRIIKIAKILANKGFVKGDIVGVIATNSEYLAAVVFACFTLGLPVNFLAPSFQKADIVHMLGMTRPKLIFCDGDIFHTVIESVLEIVHHPLIVTLVDRINDVAFLEDMITLFEKDVDFSPPDLGDISDLPAVIGCSSGTTGLPKGVCLSHSQILHQTQLFRYVDDLEQEVLFSFSALYWLTGIIFLVGGTLYGSKRVITRKTFDPDFMLHVLQKYKVTNTLAAPCHVSLLLNNDQMKPLKIVRTFQCAGAVVSKQLIEKMQPFLPNGVLSPVYGTTEAGSYISCGYEVTHKSGFGSTGQLFKNIEVKVILDTKDNLIGPEEQGEVCVKTPVAFLGYFKNEKQTKEFMHEDGFMHTGDIGYFDKEGFLYIVDRKKDILKYNNYHVTPSELEDVIREIEGVADCCVVGVYDQKGNDIIYAFVIKSHKKEIDDHDIQTYVNGKVADFKKIRGGVFFLSDFPMTSSGKVQRNKLKEVAEAIYEKNHNT